MEGTVAGEPVEGQFEVAVRDLIWLPEPDPDEENPRDVPFVEGWFKVFEPVPAEGEEPSPPPAVGEAAKPQLFPGETEIWVGIELSEFVLDREAAKESNVCSFDKEPIMP